MAEFLLHTTGRIDPALNISSWEKWAIVEVYEDGRCVEPPSPGSLFAIVKCPGLSLASAQKYMQPYISYVSADGEPVVVNRRLYEIDTTIIPEGLKIEVVTNRMVTIHWETAKTFVRNKATGVYEG